MRNIRDSMYDEVENLTKKRNFEDAIKKMDEMNEVYKHQDKDYWFKRGQYLLESNNYSEAIECFDKDLELNKKSYNTFRMKGISLCLSGSYHKAIECFNNALEIKFAEFLKNADQAENLKNVKKFENAIKHYDLANHSEVIDSEFWNYQALSLYNIEKYKEAKNCFDKILKNEQKNTDALLGKAKCELQLGNNESGIELLEKTVRLDPLKRKIIKEDPLISKIPDKYVKKLF